MRVAISRYVATDPFGIVCTCAYTRLQKTDCDVVLIVLCSHGRVKTVYLLNKVKFKGMHIVFIVILIHVHDGGIIR